MSVQCAKYKTRRDLNCAYIYRTFYIPLEALHDTSAAIAIYKPGELW
jgi:hypothetical protein